MREINLTQLISKRVADRLSIISRKTTSYVANNNSFLTRVVVDPQIQSQDVRKMYTDMTQYTSSTIFGV